MWKGRAAPWERSKEVTVRWHKVMVIMATLIQMVNSVGKRQLETNGGATCFEP